MIRKEGPGDYQVGIYAVTREGRTWIASATGPGTIPHDPMRFPTLGDAYWALTGEPLRVTQRGLNMSRDTGPQRRMTAREIRAAIYLSGLNGDYRVHHNIPGEAIVCHVSQASVGHAIVNGLRERQYEMLRRRRGLS